MKRRDVLRGLSTGLVLDRWFDTEDDRRVELPFDIDRSRDHTTSDEPQSLREIAERMDPEHCRSNEERTDCVWPLLGNGPPFHDDRPDPYDEANLSFSLATVATDAHSANPPDSRIVRGGPVDTRLLDQKVTYDGIRYLDTVDPWLVDDEASSSTTYTWGDAESKTETYLYNLFFAHHNAYDLGMINRTADNGTLPDGYTRKGIVESHRWIDRWTPDAGDGDEYRSIRNVVDRHQNGVRHGILWQNAKLVLSEGTLDPTDPKLTRKAAAFGERFRDAGFDIVAMCEVYNDTLLEEMADRYRLGYTTVEREFGLPALHDLGVLVGRQRLEDPIGERTITESTSDMFITPIGPDSGPGGARVNLEGWQRATIEVPGLPDNPRFELFLTHLQAVAKSQKAPDAYEDQKQQTKIQQLADLREKIERVQKNNQERPILLMGDFNIHSRGRGPQFDNDSGVRNGQYFSNLMHEMQSIGLQEAWLTYGGPAPSYNTCNPNSDGFTCDPFDPPQKKTREEYYRNDRLDYVFIEKPRDRHDMRLDVSRLRMVSFENSEFGRLSDHNGIGFELLTSPAN